MKGRFPGANPKQFLQSMMQRMNEAQEELAQKTVEAQSGGGMVTAVVDGRQELVSLRIDPGRLREAVLKALKG